MWASFLFWLSSQTHLPKIKLPIPIPVDKVEHFTAFFILTWLGWRAFRFQSAVELLEQHAVLIAFFFTCLYGVLDEIHQIYVPGRTFDYYDMVADATGATIFIIGYYLLHRLRAMRAPAVSD